MPLIQRQRRETARRLDVFDGRVICRGAVRKKQSDKDGRQTRKKMGNSRNQDVKTKNEKTE
jgi:hypothetical protein